MDMYVGFGLVVSTEVSGILYACFPTVEFKSGERVDFLSYFFLLQLMMSEESFIWSEYT